MQQSQFDAIKKCLNRTNGTCIIVEEDRPMYVIMTFEEYETLSRQTTHREPESVEPIRESSSESAGLLQGEEFISYQEQQTLLEHAKEE